MLNVEIEKTPNIERRDYLRQLALYVHKTIQINGSVIRRANELVSIGFKAFDAMHISCSEIGRADVFLTTDDRLLRLSKRYKDRLNIEVTNPLQWIMETI